MPRRVTIFIRAFAVLVIAFAAVSMYAAGCEVSSDGMRLQLVSDEGQCGCATLKNATRRPVILRAVTAAGDEMGRHTLKREEDVKFAFSPTPVFIETYTEEGRPLKIDSAITVSCPTTTDCANGGCPAQ